MIPVDRTALVKLHRSVSVCLVALIQFSVHLPSARSQVCQECDYQTLTPGMAQFQLIDPEGVWRAEGLEIDLTDPRISVETAISRSSVLGRETIGQIALRRKEQNRWLAALVGCDFPDEGGLPRGLLVQNGELLSVPGGNPSFLLTSQRTPAIGSFQYRMELELSGAERIPIQHLNRPPPDGEAALFTPYYGARAEAPDGFVEAELQLFDSYLNPTGETMVKIGRVSVLPGKQIIPRLGYVLVLPRATYEQYVDRVGFAMKARIHCRLTSDDIPQVVESELSPGGPEPAWPSRVAWAISGGCQILRDGSVILEPHDGNPDCPKAADESRYTLLGLNSFLRRLWVAVVKAVPGETVSLHDAARCLSLLGATEGMTLAGQDRSPLRIRDKTVNPSRSSQLEVPVADALLFYSAGIPSGLARLELDPSDVVFLPTNSAIDFQVTAFDESGWEIPLEDDQIEIRNPSNLGQLKGSKFIAGKRPGRADLLFRVSGVFGASYIDTTRRVTVIVQPPERLVISPAPVVMDPGERVDLNADLVDREGNSLVFPSDEIEWHLKGCEGVISPRGSLIASATGKGSVGARYRRWRDSVPVYVGLLRPTLLDGLEAPEIWGTHLQLTPGAACRLEAMPGLPPGEVAARLHYTLPETENAEVVLRRWLPIEDSPHSFRLDVLGDGSGHKLRCLVEDRLGRRFQIPFREPIHWRSSWRTLEAPLNLAWPLAPGEEPRLRLPLTFLGLVLAKGPRGVAGDGEFGLRRLEVIYMDF